MGSWTQDFSWRCMHTYFDHGGDDLHGRIEQMTTPARYLHEQPSHLRGLLRAGASDFFTLRSS